MQIALPNFFSKRIDDNFRNEVLNSSELRKSRKDMPGGTWELRNNTMSARKEEYKRRIYAQADRVKNIFPNINVSEQTNFTMKEDSRSQVSFGPSDLHASLPNLSAGLGHPSKAWARRETSRIDSNTKPQESSKRRKLVCSADGKFHHLPVHYATDESILHDELLSPCKGNDTVPGTPPFSKELFSSNSPLFSPAIFECEGMRENRKWQKHRSSVSLQPKSQAWLEETGHEAPLGPKLSQPPFRDMALTQNDVVCDTRGVIKDNLIGNRRFSILLDLYQQSYVNATSTVERYGTAQKIINSIREALPPGRVIVMDQTTGLCSVVIDDVATKIIERALARKAGFMPIGGNVA